MPYYLLGWPFEGGLVTVDLISGQRLILVHSDQQLASGHTAALTRSTGRVVAVYRLESARADMKARLESIVGAGLLSGIDLVFSDDPTYLTILNELVADSG